MSRDYFGNLPVVAGMAFSRDVLLLDDCEGAFTWQTAGTGGDDVHEYLAAAAFAGTAGLHLKTRTTSAAENDSLLAQKWLGYPETGLLVARAKIASPSWAAVKTINFIAVHGNGARNYNGQLQYTPATGVVAYANAAGAATAIAALAHQELDYQFTTWELVIDCRAHQYLAVAINGLRASLAGVDLWDSAAAAQRYAGLGLGVTTSGAVSAELYASHLYVGENLEA